MAVSGAPALPSLPEEASTFEASFRHSITRWKSDLKSLNGSMSKVGTGRAGAPKFPSPMTPAEQAAKLGLEWPRTGEDRCRLCPTCLAGGCKRQGRADPCLGCQQKKRCDLLACTTSYLKAPSVANSEVFLGVVTSTTLLLKVSWLLQSGEEYKAAFELFIDSLCKMALECENILSRSQLVLGGI